MCDKSFQEQLLDCSIVVPFRDVNEVFIKKKALYITATIDGIRFSHADQ